MKAGVKNTSGQSMTCAEFQDQLPELFESGADLHTQEHLLHCEQCSELVRDLEYIAQQARLLLPLHDPNPTVWDRIGSSLQHERKISGTGRE